MAAHFWLANFTVRFSSEFGNICLSRSYEFLATEVTGASIWLRRYDVQYFACMLFRCCSYLSGKASFAKHHPRNKHLRVAPLSWIYAIHHDTRTDSTHQRAGEQVQLAMMPSHRSRDKARVRHEPGFHKKRFWQPADQDYPHHDPNHAGFCLRNLETSLSQAMRLHRRHSTSEESATQLRRVRVVDPSEASPRSLLSHSYASKY